MGGRDDLARGHPPPQHPSGIWGCSASRGRREPGPPRMRNRSDSASLLFSSFVKPNLFSLAYRQTLKFPGCRPDFGVRSPGRITPGGSGSGNPRLGRAEHSRAGLRGCGAGPPRGDHPVRDFPRFLPGRLVSRKLLRFPLGPLSPLPLLPPGSLWAPRSGSRSRAKHRDEQTTPGILGKNGETAPRQPAIPTNRAVTFPAGKTGRTRGGGGWERAESAAGFDPDAWNPRMEPSMDLSSLRGKARPGCGSASPSLESRLSSIRGDPDAGGMDPQPHPSRKRFPERCCGWRQPPWGVPSMGIQDGPAGQILPLEQPPGWNDPKNDAGGEKKPQTQILLVAFV